MSQKIEGEVVSIDSDGNLLTDIEPAALADAPRDETVSVLCDGHETLGIFPPDHDQPMGTFLATLGGDEPLKLGIVGISVAEMLRIKVGAKVVVKW